MNPNDLLAQQQALLNQYMQNAQHAQLGALALSLAFFLLGGWVIYMFYACFRRIEDEIRMFRISFEFANPPKERTTTRQTGAEENPFSKG
jgi:hypothetical protein